MPPPITVNPRVYVSNRVNAGASVEVAQGKKVLFTRDKNLRLAVFVPPKARVEARVGGTHVATEVSRRDFHQLRAVGARADATEQDKKRALSTAQNIFEAVEGLSELAAQLPEPLQLKLAQRMADANFECAYRDLKPELQLQALTLELAGRTDDLAVLEMAAGSAVAAETLDDFCKAVTPDDVKTARVALYDALLESQIERSFEKFSQQAASYAKSKGVPEDWSQDWVSNSVGLTLSKAAVSASGRLMPPDYFAAMAQKIENSKHSDSLLGPELKQFLKGQLKHLETSTELRERLGSIGAPPPENEVVQTQIRSTLKTPDREAVSPAQARTAVISALMTPLRQGEVGSCFATSAGIAQQVDDPIRMVNSMKSMIERGWIETTVASRRERIHLHPGLGVSSLPLKTNSTLQSSMTQQAVKGALVALGLRADQATPEAKKLADSATKALQNQPNATVDDVLQCALAQHLGFSVSTDPNSGDTPRLKALSDELKGQTSPGEQLQTLRKAIVALNAEVHRLSGAQPPKDEEIEQAIDDLDAMYMMMKTGSFDGALRQGQQPFDLVQYESALRVGRSVQAGMTENRLLRTWEYTLATAGQSESRSTELVTAVQKWADTATESAMQKSANNGMSRSKRTEICAQFRRDFNHKVNSRLVYRFVTDLPIAQSADGSSDRGGWVLYDRTGSADPAHWKKIEDEQDLRMVLAGLALEASTATAALRKSNTSKSFAQTLGHELDAASQGAHFDQSIWQSSAGGSLERILRTVDPRMRKRILLEGDQGRTPIGLFEELVEGLKGYPSVSGDPTSASFSPVLVATESHGFRLLPQSWHDVMAENGPAPLDWLNERLKQDGDEVRLADTNWGTGKAPIYMVLRKDAGDIKIGFSKDGAFLEDSIATKFMKSSWNLFEPVNSIMLNGVFF